MEQAGVRSGAVRGRAPPTREGLGQQQELAGGAATWPPWAPAVPGLHPSPGSTHLSPHLKEQSRALLRGQAGDAWPRPRGLGQGTPEASEWGLAPALGSQPPGTLCSLPSLPPSRCLVGPGPAKGLGG